MQSVDIVDILLTLLDLSLDPVAIEVAEEMVVVSAGSGVALPLFDIEAEQRLIRVLDHLFMHTGEVALQVLVKSVVEILAEKVRAPMRAVQLARLLLADRLLGCAEVVDGGVEGHVRLEVNAILQTVHDPLHAPLEIVPCAGDVVFVGGHLRCRPRRSSCFRHDDCGTV